MSAFSRSPETYKLPGNFNLTEHMRQLKLKQQTGELQREAEATAEQARVQADKDAALIAEEQRKAKLLREDRLRIMQERAEVNIARIRAETEARQEATTQARYAAMQTQRPISVGELQNRMASIAAARRS